MYSQDCHFGYLIEISNNKDIMGDKAVECHNPKCIERYCKFSLFTGGQISDKECEFFVRNRRGKDE